MLFPNLFASLRLWTTPPALRPHWPHTPIAITSAPRLQTRSTTHGTEALSPSIPAPLNAHPPIHPSNPSTTPLAPPPLNPAESPPSPSPSAQNPRIHSLPPSIVQTQDSACRTPSKTLDFYTRARALRTSADQSCRAPESPPASRNLELATPQVESAMPMPMPTPWIPSPATGRLRRSLDTDSDSLAWRGCLTD
ncbi:hypothetical protein BS50DRAFT_190348 [Corynespora cassiicola Philippines]|uniref:Uncharacterized protein n=1 Tax=Corynespora cassiicola Philippines TaxID=1448308 RepID=A0A2T2P7L6_CORCC|nr:hypothetical protein BS50DRAFT_190348 [Corynespora cassiicola Philippines]